MWRARKELLLIVLSLAVLVLCFTPASLASGQRSTVELDRVGVDDGTPGALLTRESIEAEPLLVPTDSFRL